MKEVILTLKQYLLVVFSAAMGLLFFLYGFSFCFTRLIFNIITALLLGSIFYFVNKKIIKKKIDLKKTRLIKKILIYFLSIFFVAFIFIYILKIMINIFDFTILSFYFLDNSFKSSLGLSMIMTPIHCCVLLYRKKIELEKFNSEMLVKQERNKIAGELHDDIGFNLTSAIIQLNLAHKLIQKGQSNSSLDCIALSKNQLKYALENIRLKVRLVEDEFNFKDEFNFLIMNFKKLANVDINFEIDDFINIDDKHKILVYRAVKEGLNNGIRHGNANYFELKLIMDEKEMLFILKNNGENDFNKIEKGFGLNNLESKVKKMGGRLKTYIDNDNFFVLKFNIYLN